MQKNIRRLRTAEKAEKRRFTSEDRARGGSHARQSKFARDTIWIVVGALTFHFLLPQNGDNQTREDKLFLAAKILDWLSLVVKQV